MVYLVQVTTTLYPPPAIIIDDPGTITLNSGFDGGGDSELIDSSSTLAVADTARIRFIVDVNTIVDNGSHSKNRLFHLIKPYWISTITSCMKKPFWEPSCPLNSFEEHAKS